MIVMATADKKTAPPLPPAVPGAKAAPAKAAPKAKAAGKVRVTLVKSRSNADDNQTRNLIGLNLRKMNDSSVLEDTKAVRGMIAKVQHLVQVDKA